MSLKNSLFSWFIRFILSPQIEKIDSPGFTITSFSESGKETYLRDIFLEDELFSRIEKKIVEKYGNRGKKALYSAGKKFGYIYASLSNFTQLEDDNEKKFVSFGNFLVNYIATIYASAADYKGDIRKKRFEIEFENYVICSKNGLGHIMTEGGIGGIWAFMIKDKNVEAVQVSCQGRGDKRCHIIVGLPEDLKKEGLEPMIETDLVDLKFNPKYKAYNLVRKAEFAQNSLRDLLNSHIFNYSKGFLTYHNIRFFHCESNILYILENELSGLPNGKANLFDAGYEYGAFLQSASGNKDYKKFINDYFPALGWGDVIALQKETLKVISSYYPWTEYSNKSEYIIFRGILSGLVSTATGKKIKFEKFKQSLTEYLTLEVF